jgi:hypothetical protein
MVALGPVEETWLYQGIRERTSTHEDGTTLDYCIVDVADDDGDKGDRNNGST